MFFLIRLLYNSFLGIIIMSLNDNSLYKICQGKLLVFIFITFLLNFQI
jgi:hypothetical protein